ncbi:ribD C-terminal domain protein [Mycobacterium ulcerans str. Harvey]|uniref:RibD C-terminal domain protein n=1 Tax=Mycobacterium ulcerans str. Harvey TaxID=1299332 RepID=A0ABN0QW01_MYCUL|nr:ribD C-terminal domain protein [Mycobacterium ulcerans str. Harvey]
MFDTATTLNGWIADENNSLAWLFAVDQGGLPESGLVPTEATVMVEGSTTYQWVIETESILDHPEKWQQFYGDKPTFVFTTRELPVPAGADVRFVSGSVLDVLPTIEEAAGAGDIWVVGGGDLAGQFLDAGALDEIRSSVAPVALAGGAPLLPRCIGPIGSAWFPPLLMGSSPVLSTPSPHQSDPYCHEVPGQVSPDGPTP